MGSRRRWTRTSAGRGAAPCEWRKRERVGGEDRGLGAFRAGFPAAGGAGAGEDSGLWAFRAGFRAAGGAGGAGAGEEGWGVSCWISGGWRSWRSGSGRGGLGRFVLDFQRLEELEEREREREDMVREDSAMDTTQAKEVGFSEDKSFRLSGDRGGAAPCMADCRVIFMAARRGQSTYRSEEFVPGHANIVTSSGYANGESLWMK